MEQQEDADLNLLNNVAQSSSGKRARDAPSTQAVKRARTGRVSPSPGPKPTTKASGATNKHGKLNRPSLISLSGQSGSQPYKKQRDVYDADAAEQLTINRKPLKIISKGRQKATQPKIPPANTPRAKANPRTPVSSPTTEKQRAPVSSKKNKLPRPNISASKDIGSTSLSQMTAERQEQSSHTVDGAEAEPVAGQVAKTQASDSIQQDHSSSEPNVQSSESIADKESPLKQRTRKKTARRRSSAVTIEQDEQTQAEEAAMILGRTDNWKTMMQASTTIWKCHIDKDIHTNEVKKLRPTLRGLVALYKQIHDRQRDGRSTKEFESEIPPAIEKASDMLDNIARTRLQDRRSELVQDIYVMVAPTFVILLKWVMKCRVQPATSSIYSAKGLKEVVKLQDMALSFLERVVGWDIKPDTDFAIVRPVKGRMVPHLRFMSKAFTGKLANVKRLEKIRQNAAKHTVVVVLDEEDSELERERSAQSKQESIDRLMDGFASEKRRWQRHGSIHQFEKPIPFRPHSRQPEVRVEWTQKEDQALCDELLNNLDTRFLPVEERYLKALTQPSLQNKLPEHIRERALFLKDSLIEAAVAYNKGPTPPYLLNIE